MTPKKSVKDMSSKELAVQIKEYELEFDRWADERIETIKAMDKEFTVTVTKATQSIEKAKEKPEKYKYQTIEEAGKFLERTGLVPTHKISGKILNKFSGVISRSWITYVINDINRDWKSKGNRNRGIGKSNWQGRTGKGPKKSTSGLFEELTTRDKQVLESSKDQFEAIQELSGAIRWITGKDFVSVNEFESNLSSSQTRQNLLDVVKDNMLTHVKQMKDSTLVIALNYLRSLSYLADQFGNMIYEEKERRDKTRGIAGV